MCRVDWVLLTADCVRCALRDERPGHSVRRLDKKVFPVVVSAQQSSYAMGVSPDGQLQHLYWGGPLWRTRKIYPRRPLEKPDISSFDPHQMLEAEEYPGWGGPRYLRTGVEDITRADGDRDSSPALFFSYNRRRHAGDNAKRHQ